MQSRAVKIHSVRLPLVHRRPLEILTSRIKSGFERPECTHMPFPSAVARESRTMSPLLSLLMSRGWISLVSKDPARLILVFG
jgi:hypothetical protein